MKKIAIITLYGNDNFGNKLQNLALQETLEKEECTVETLKNFACTNELKKIIPRTIKFTINKLKQKFIDRKREKKFKEFNNNIKYNKRMINAINYKKFDSYDYYIVGSDQVWNPELGGLRFIDTLSFVAPEKRISYAASFAVNDVDDISARIIQKELINFKALSVREEQGKKIIKKHIPNDVSVVLDPTMLLSGKEWEKYIKKPNNEVPKKYILCYFLGKNNEERESAIQIFAAENNCEIINILDKKSPYYVSGPGEFLYLEKNAFLVCTDSFHSCVFAILFKKPFVVFERNGVKKSMGSRIDTLLNKLNLENQKINGKSIKKENIDFSYEEANRLLEIEKTKSIGFLKKALDIEESDEDERK